MHLYCEKCDVNDAEVKVSLSVVGGEILDSVWLCRDCAIDSLGETDLTNGKKFQERFGSPPQWVAPKKEAKS